MPDPNYLTHDQSRTLVHLAAAAVGINPHNIRSITITPNEAIVTRFHTNPNGDAVFTNGIPEHITSHIPISGWCGPHGCQYTDPPTAPLTAGSDHGSRGGWERQDHRENPPTEHQ